MGIMLYDRIADLPLVVDGYDFEPDSPNDVAPGGYNDPGPRHGLPSSPLAPPSDPAGFRFPRSE